MARKISRIFVNMILYLMILFLLGLSAPKLAGWKWVGITSGSMLPTLPIGCACLVKDTPAEDVRKGDILTFTLENGSLATHRVRSVNADKSFVTQGDNNDHHDARPVQPDEVVGTTVLHIQNLGYIQRMLVYPWSKLFVIGVILLLCTLSAALGKPPAQEAADAGTGTEDPVSGVTDDDAMETGCPDGEDPVPGDTDDDAMETGCPDREDAEPEPSDETLDSGPPADADTRTELLTSQVFGTLSEVVDYVSGPLGLDRSLATQVACRAVQSGVSPEYHTDLAVRLFAKLFDEKRV